MSIVKTTAFRKQTRVLSIILSTGNFPHSVFIGYRVDLTKYKLFLKIGEAAKVSKSTITF